MKLKLPLVAAFVAILSLSACGGGSDSNNVVADNPAALTKTDTVVGTGAEAVVGKTATVTYTGYLYSIAAPANKGNKFDAGTLSFLVGSTQLIKGFDQGVQGMKVGGKRTVVIPASLGYGASGSGNIPANAGLVFDIELTAVK